VFALAHVVFVIVFLLFWLDQDLKMNQAFVAKILLLQTGLLIGHVKTEINQRTNAQSIEQVTSSSSFTSTENWKKDCSKSYSSTCLKLDVVSFVDRLSEQDDLGMEFFFSPYFFR
jgi:hypothetical protein